MTDFDNADFYETHERDYEPEKVGELEFIEVEAETPKAVLLRCEEGAVWLPKSQIRRDGNTVYYPKWITLDFFDNGEF